jgi:hypothetical protein
MKATIENLFYKDYEHSSEGRTKPAIQALLDRKGFVKELGKTEELVDIRIICNGIIIRDDCISVEFPNGLIADYEIESDDYHRIIIL